jgi:TetR/AcrR family transcriptional regulator, regulator of cefoperazone and chloramphenicol sensitivity
MFYSGVLMEEQNNLLSDTKKRIIETAGNIFAELGFQNTTVREICKQAGVNIAAINYHFGDKKGLYLAVLKYGKDSAFQRHPLEIMPDKPFSPEDRLKDFVSRFIGRVRECHEGEFPWVRKLIAHELLRPTEGLDMVAEEGIKPIFKALSAIVREILGRDATEDTINLCCASIVSQSLFFFYAQPMIKRLFPGKDYTDTKLIGDHITRFSLSAIKELEVHKKGDRK